MQTSPNMYLRNRIIRQISALSFGVIITFLIYVLVRGSITIPQYIDLGIIKIYLYSLTLLAAFLTCIYLLHRIQKQDAKLAAIDVWAGLLYIFIPAIIFARLYHVITDFHLYRDNLLNAFAIWNGGLGIIGGMAGGILGLFIFARRRNLPFKDMLGAVAVVLPIGQVIGRLGNLFNHELYGPPTDLPWGQFIPEAFRKAGYENFSYFHPLFLYEALANLVLFAMLWNLWQRGWRGLKLVWVYLGGYGIIRFSLDFMRIDGNTGVSGLSYTQWLILGVLMSWILGYTVKRFTR